MLVNYSVLPEHLTWEVYNSRRKPEGGRGYPVPVENA